MNDFVIHFPLIPVAFLATWNWRSDLKISTKEGSNSEDEDSSAEFGDNSGCGKAGFGAVGGADR
jgi:hypothetical protein